MATTFIDLATGSEFDPSRLSTRFGGVVLLEPTSFIENALRANTGPGQTSTEVRDSEQYPGWRIQTARFPLTFAPPLGSDAVEQAAEVWLASIAVEIDGASVAATLIVSPYIRVVASFLSIIGRGTEEPLRYFRPDLTSYFERYKGDPTDQLRVNSVTMRDTKSATVDTITVSGKSPLDSGVYEYLVTQEKLPYRMRFKIVRPQHRLTLCFDYFGNIYWFERSPLSRVEVLAAIAQVLASTRQLATVSVPTRRADWGPVTGGDAQ